MSALLTLEPEAAAVAARVTPEEYARLLMLPRRALREEEGLAARARDAAAWYAAHGRPWIGARRLDIERLDDERVILATGQALGSAALAGRLREAGAHAVAALAVTAGAEVDAEYRRRWADGRPDEGFFVQRLGVAVAEQLVRIAAAWTCRAAAQARETVIFHASPGCGGWPLVEQAGLMGLLAGEAATAVGPVAMLPSGALLPSHSVLALFGLTHRRAAPAPAEACRACGLAACAFRRAPYRKAA